MMHTIVETPIFIRRAKKLGISDERLDTIKMLLAQKPDSGVEMPGTGGARKLRVAAEGKGKSGGYRVITFYTGKNLPVFLLDIYAKGEKIDLTQDEKNILKRVLGQIAETYREKDHE